MANGAPNVYHRVNVTVIADSGKDLNATTYCVLPGKAKKFVVPATEYLSIVQKGLERWDISSDLLQAAAANHVTACPAGFFFYGTLLRDEPRFSILSSFGIECTLLAQTRGRLLDLGNFPGLVDAGASDSLVQGEFVRLHDPESAIRKLDAIEGFRGFGQNGSLFRRTWVPIHVGEGRIRDAWTYCLSTNTDRADPIQSGDWRQHLGRRMDFLRRLVSIHSCGNEVDVAAKIVERDMHLPDNARGHAVNSLLPLDAALDRGDFSERKLAQVSGTWVAIP